MSSEPSFHPCMTSLTTKLKVKRLTTKAESKAHTHLLRKTPDYFPSISPEPLRMCLACLCCEPPENSPQIWNAVQREVRSPMNGPAGTGVSPSAAVVQKGTGLCNRAALDRRCQLSFPWGRESALDESLALCPSRRQTSIWPQILRQKFKHF